MDFFQRFFFTLKQNREKKETQIFITAWAVLWVLEVFEQQQRLKKVQSPDMDPHQWNLKKPMLFQSKVNELP